MICLIHLKTLAQLGIKTPPNLRVFYKTEPVPNPREWILNPTRIWHWATRPNFKTQNPTRTRRNISNPDPNPKKIPKPNPTHHYCTTTGENQLRTSSRRNEPTTILPRIFHIKVTKLIKKGLFGYKRILEGFLLSFWKVFHPKVFHALTTIKTRLSTTTIKV